MSDRDELRPCYRCHADCLVAMRAMEPGSVTAVVTDPPYGLEFMGKEWDHGIPGVPFWLAALRVAKPGAILLAFGGTRTFHRLTCAIEDAGWEIRDCIMWVYGSGFPKSLDIGKAIDKAAGAEREVVGAKNYSAPDIRGNSSNGRGISSQSSKDADRLGVSITAPATEAAKLWNGYGTALKPAYEPIIIAMKPLVSTFAANALEHGVAGVNVDGCRVGTEDKLTGSGGPCLQFGGQNNRPYQETFEAPGCNQNPQGRWPANLIHDGSDEVVALFPQNGSSNARQNKAGGCEYFMGGDTRENAPWDISDTGSAARFFYAAKSSRRERDAGLDSIRTVKYNVPIGGALCKDVTMALVESLRKATSESTLTWHIGESGESIVGLCPSDTLSTTLTAISRITTSQILSLLTPSLTSAFTQAVSCETASGGNPVENAESSSKYQPITPNASLAESAHGASRVVYEMLLTISDGENWRPRRNIHSTVKPLALMRYLCCLTATPTGGVVLDPFMGSGSTGCAAVLEGREFVGIEQDREFVEIAGARIAHARKMAELGLEVTYKPPKGAPKGTPLLDMLKEIDEE